MTTKTFEVERAKDFDRAIKALDARGFEDRAGKVFASHVLPIMEVYQAAVRTEFGRHVRTGKMRDRVIAGVDGSGFRAAGIVTASGRGSNLIVGGVKPHPIAPGATNPGWVPLGMPLWGKGELMGFAQAVEHPGFPADPVVTKGRDKAQPEVDRRLQTLTEKLRDELVPQGG